MSKFVLEKKSYLYETFVLDITPALIVRLQKEYDECHFDEKIEITEDLVRLAGNTEGSEPDQYIHCRDDRGNEYEIYLGDWIYDLLYQYAEERDAAYWDAVMFDSESRIED